MVPSVSVVMTSYNHEEYLSEAIDSILAQSYPDFELIIVDDASADGSREIIHRYQRTDSRIHSIIHKTNQGISRTTNDGFMAARGKYIAYMQSDDLWLPEKLQKQLDVIRQNNDLVVWSEALIVDCLGRANGHVFTQKAADKKKSGNILSDLAKDNYICGQSIMLRSDNARATGFDSSLIYANDYKFMLQLAGKHDFYFIDEPLVKYRIHGNNSIFKNRDIWKKDMCSIKIYVLHEYGTRIPVATKAKLYNQIGRYLCKRNHFKYAAKCFGQAVVMNWRKTSYYRRFLRSYFKSILK